jgi:malonyl-CoA/methylmalonyl-CoA synthetase
MSDNLFTRFAAPQRNKTFLEVPGRGAISYAESFAAAARFAQVLARAGVKKGDRVAVQVEKSPEALFLYFACLKLGAVYLPLNPAYTPAELSYFIADAEPALFVSSPQNEAMIGAIFSGAILTLGDDGRTGSLIAAAAAMPSGFDDAVMGRDDLAAILYTSGTTGRSKGAMLSHGNLWSNASVLKELWHFTERDVLLHALPVFHIHGLFVATNVALAAGAAMIFLPKFDPAAMLAAMPDASVMMGVPTYYVRLLKEAGLSRQKAGHMRLFISGSAPLLTETHRQWRERTGHAILERYGMTETGMNTSNPYDGDRLPGSVGFPLPGTELRIAGRDGKALPPGEIGMIEVRGPNVFLGYWRMPDKTKAEFRDDGFFITGDLGVIDKNGYVHISGRGKDLIISGGLNIYPKEVESLIDAMDGVAESAVVGLAHADFGEAVTAFVVRKDGASLDEKQVLQALAGRLARFKQPKRVLFVDQFPRNSMGKVQKNQLRDQFSDLYAARQENAG